MHITVTKNKLRTALSAVVPTIPSPTPLPALAQVLIEAKDGGCSISATDLDVWAKVQVDADVAEDGAIAAPGQLLNEIVREFTEDIVTMEVKKNRVKISCGKLSNTLNLFPEDDYPRLSEELDFEEGWTIPTASILKMIEGTVFAVSEEENRPTLQGVLWEMEPGSSAMVATNGHRLCRQSTKTTGGTEKTKFVVPSRSLKLVGRVFGDAEEITVSLPADDDSSGRRTLGLRSERASLHMRLLQGSYPNYRQVIPKEYTRTCVLDRKRLAWALRSAVPLARRIETNKVALSFNSGDKVVSVDVQNEDLGTYHAEMPIEEYEGDEIMIGFNAAYLLDVLRSIEQDHVKLMLTTIEMAATIVPHNPGAPDEAGSADAASLDADDSGGDDPELFGDYFGLVMPLRLLV